MDKLKCLRCGHEWYPRSPQAPLKCPGCNNKLWKIPRGSKEVVDAEEAQTGPRG